jgi:hypothetical protein
MAPPPTARWRCDRPVGAGRSTALKAALAPHQPGPGRRIVLRTGKPSADSRAKPEPKRGRQYSSYRPQGGGLSPITLSPPLPQSAPVGLPTYSLPNLARSASPSISGGGWPYSPVLGALGSATRSTSFGGGHILAAGHRLPADMREYSFDMTSTGGVRARSCCIWTCDRTTARLAHDRAAEFLPLTGRPVICPRGPDLHRARRRGHLPRPGMPVAHHQPPAVLARLGGMRRDVGAASSSSAAASIRRVPSRTISSRPAARSSRAASSATPSALAFVPAGVGPPASSLLITWEGTPRPLVPHPQLRVMTFSRSYVRLIAGSSPLPAGTAR